MSARSIAAWLLILAAWGCQSTPPPASPDQPSPQAGTEDTADTPQALLAEAERAPSRRASRLYLQAAEGFLQQGELQAAADALNAVEVDRLRRRDAARYLLARATVNLRLGALDDAQDALNDLDPSDLDDPLGAALIRAELLAARGQAAAAAASLMALSAETGARDGTDAMERMNDLIWKLMRQVPALQVADREAASSGAVRAWWLLKLQMLESFTLSEQRLRLEAWRGSWPQHPAAVRPPSALATLTDGASTVRRVALLLPLSGPLSRAGRAVRDGFIASYLAHRDEVGFDVKIYDVAAESLGTLYERALLDGTDLIIGPLSKESVAEINGLNPELPVLALNYLAAETPSPNLLQLGLAIEDEAATLKQWLSDQQVQRLLVFHNDEDWAQRAMRTVTQAWRGPLDVQALHDIRTFTESVGVAMHVRASEERRAELEDVLGEPLEFLPRARGDVDAIVALVSRQEVDALVPALKFHFADRVPVYATSQTLRGNPPEQQGNLNGFHVAELPWLVRQDSSYQAMDDAFGLSGNPFVSLYALGVDAFRLSERVPLILEGGFSELLGSTGELSFASGRIQRRLERTVIRRGRPTRAAGAYGR